MIFCVVGGLILVIAAVYMTIRAFQSINGQEDRRNEPGRAPAPWTVMSLAKDFYGRTEEDAVAFLNANGYRATPTAVNFLVTYRGFLSGG